MLTVSCLRVRSNVRTSCVGLSGTKLGRIRPCANRSDTQSASFTSLLRPGTFLTCAAAGTNAKSPSDKMCEGASVAGAVQPRRALAYLPSFEGTVPDHS